MAKKPKPPKPFTLVRGTVHCQGGITYFCYYTYAGKLAYGNVPHDRHYHVPLKRIKAYLAQRAEQSLLCIKRHAEKAVTLHPEAYTVQRVEQLGGYYYIYYKTYQSNDHYIYMSEAKDELDAFCKGTARLKAMQKFTDRARANRAQRNKELFK